MLEDSGPTVSGNSRFQFARKTFAYKRFAQIKSRPVSAFLSLMREYLDPVVIADQCAQYVGDIGIEANNATDLSRNNREVFECIRKAGLKLIREIYHFVIRQMTFLGRTKSPERISPQARKCHNLLSRLRFAESKNEIQCYLGLVQFYTKVITRMTEKLSQYCKLPKKETPINIKSETKQTFDSVKKH